MSDKPRTLCRPALVVRRLGAYVYEVATLEDLVLVETDYLRCFRLPRSIFLTSNTSARDEIRSTPVDEIDGIAIGDWVLMEDGSDRWRRMEVVG